MSFELGLGLSLAAVAVILLVGRAFYGKDAKDTGSLGDDGIIDLGGRDHSGDVSAAD